MKYFSVFVIHGLFEIFYIEIRSANAMKTFTLMIKRPKVNIKEL